MNMKTDTDFCNAAHPYCTYTLPAGGARFNKCVRSSACGNTNTFFIVKDTIVENDIKIKAAGICDYTLYFTMMDPTTDFSKIDQPSNALAMGDQSSATGPFQITKNMSLYTGDTRFFGMNNAAVGLYHNVTLDEDDSVVYGQAYSLVVATK